MTHGKQNKGELKYQSDLIRLAGNSNSQSAHGLALFGGINTFITLEFLQTLCKTIIVSITMTEIEHLNYKFKQCTKVKGKLQTTTGIDEKKRNNGEKSNKKINEDMSRGKQIELKA